MSIEESRATKIPVVASTKAQALRVILASPSFRPETRLQHCRLPIADCRLESDAKSSKQEIGNRQLAIR